MEKKLLFFALPLFLIAVFAGLTSAATVNATGIPNPLSISSTYSSFNINLISNSNGTVNINISKNITSSFGNGVIYFTYPKSVNLTANTSKQVTIYYNVSDPNSYFNFLAGYSTKIDLSGTNFTSKTYNLNVKNNDFCSGVPNVVNILRVNQPEFKIVSGYGDSSEWYLLDNISASVEIDNNNPNFDMRNVKVEWALYTTQGEKVDSGSLNTFNLNSDDSKTVNINFQLDKNFNKIDRSGRVLLYIKASGTINNPDAPYTYDGNKSCSFYNNPEQNYVQTGDDFVVPTDLNLNGNLITEGQTLNQTLSCGSTVNVAGTAYNIGSNDQSGVSVGVYNQELGINQKINLNDLNGFNSQDFSTTFTIPKNASEKSYRLRFLVYNDNNNVFQNSQNDESIKDVYFNVAGNCMITPPSVAAELSAGTPQEGKTITVHVNLKNQDPHQQTFILSAEGYSSWSNLVNMTPQTFTLQPGASQDVYMTLNLKSNSKGSRQFNLVATSNGNIVVNKPILVDVQAGSFWNNLGSSGINWTLIGIVVLNLILVIAIIIVAVKVLKRR